MRREGGGRVKVRKDGGGREANWGGREAGG